MDLRKLGRKQLLILNYMIDGFYILTVVDHFENTETIELTNGDDTLFNVPRHTVESFMRRGIVEQSESAPCLQITLVKHIFKGSAKLTQPDRGTDAGRKESSLTAEARNRQCPTTDNLAKTGGREATNKATFRQGGV